MTASSVQAIPMPASVRQRRLLPEIMDDPALDPALHEGALRGLGRINRFSGSAGMMWPTIEKLCAHRKYPLRVLDLACGGGDVLIALARKAAKLSCPVQWLGCDMSPVALDFARGQAEAAGVEIEFRQIDVFQNPLPNQLDLAMNSLFMHHLDESQAVAVLQAMSASAQTVLINDLRRSALAHAVTVAGTRLLSRSPVVHVDGPRSVQAAWTPNEFKTLADRAGLAGANVSNRFPWRMLMHWQRPAAVDGVTS